MTRGVSTRAPRDCPPLAHADPSVSPLAANAMAARIESLLSNGRVAVTVLLSRGLVERIDGAADAELLGAAFVILLRGANHVSEVVAAFVAGA
jgi:hypothetical protein